MPKKVLLVDDEPAIRGIYALLPPFLGPEYEVSTASSAREALQKLAQGPVDIIVSDLMMPEMMGTELLAHVAERWPATARIVVSGFVDEITVAKCLLAAHRYFSKPFDPAALTSAIKSLVRARDASNSGAIRRLVGKLEALPTPSDTYLGLMRALNAQDKTLSEIAEILERDPSLAAKVLQAVNSATFGAGHRVVSLIEALQIIGLQVLRALVLTIQVFDFYRNPDLKNEFRKVWSHSANVANQARQVCLARKWPAEVSEEAFLAALLHDIGRIVLAATPDAVRTRLFPDYQLIQGDAPCPVSHAIEAETGAYLLGLWGIPETIVTVVRTCGHLSVPVDEPSAAAALAIAHELEISSHITVPRSPDPHCQSILIMSSDAALTETLMTRCRMTNRFHMVASTPAEALQTFHDLQFDIALVDPHLFPYPLWELESHLRQVNATTPIRVLQPEQPALDQVHDLFDASYPQA